MKAVVCAGHGSPERLQIRDLKVPSIKPDEILVKIVATTVTSGDVALRKQPFLQFLLLWPLARLFFGIKNQRKKILGHEFSGVVDSVGADVSGFKKGDAVFGTSGFQGGAHAEYIACSGHSIVTIKPEDLSFEEAAALPVGGICALDFLNKAKIQAGDKVLIYGASGSIGSYGVQLARHFGAHVTGVCSTGNLDLVRSLGADAVLDYSKSHITDTNDTYDVVFDTVGKFPKSKAKRLLSRNGRYVSTHASPVKEDIRYLKLIKDLASQGIIKAVIDKTYSLDDIRDAHAYVETGRKKGNVVIKINTNL